ncbi:aspartyl-phosphate phosphatase Spo0E family protein [Clostridium akagii]|uniref:aspartyl-phosphate phosphatase Spo0E family protein n=1 Tax=Clostridium akagii TaxID=91623 RepID=UPI000A045ED9|nr:aspartyl-phosphate phosphatase Spo0E family protein [Clostridium akagii]
MNLDENIEILREQLDYMLLTDCDIFDDKVIKLSTELDELINRYYSYYDKSNFSTN